MPRTVLDRADAVRALAGVFRRRGFESGSLSVIQQETGIGRGSLYHFFPDGKADMARAVLAQVRAWFDEQVFAPLRTADDAAQAVAAMSQVVEEYFVSRERVCLFAAMTLGEEQETFAREVRAYFADWVGVLAETLRRGGIVESDAADLAVDAVAAIQGGLIMTRALDDDAVFTGIVARTDRRLQAALT
ncbi:transcriptional regulator, TetR family [Pseudarthrobacter chlorophenolicus A6]|uniref:Transcriptional regulator, TetR family n=1 Tax=Pseudarthrobacter chlorophenolicus (strain ATCC 700700 / DSM 12829 / CIP 107037 / JCM 12360 / KCTC 9906 / NCIMB 13794 / A6) TaxID=452863 RepID=B8H872_PSECP|nr:TetR/AcrR family transcriptional regulator [Pseudarthrobacter chlorophenolicus]ACL38046.1 transcriptional regulator, TetR family [Pseudarthrobacter chlorophenolicus A6]SDQ56087.1 DNA-binding transcriptional regulator, AcrR family [Pseudarthrobacter chlorophenolicus]